MALERPTRDFQSGYSYKTDFLSDIYNPTESSARIKSKFWRMIDKLDLDNLMLDTKDGLKTKFLIIRNTQNLVQLRKAKVLGTRLPHQ